MRSISRSMGSEPPFGPGGGQIILDEGTHQVLQRLLLGEAEAPGAIRGEGGGPPDHDVEDLLVEGEADLLARRAGGWRLQHALQPGPAVRQQRLQLGLRKRHPQHDHGPLPRDAPWRRARMPLLSDADGELLAAGDAILSARMAAWLRAHGARLRWARVA